MRRRTRGEDDRRLLQRTAPLHGRRALLGRSAAAAATAIAGVTLGQQRSVAAAGAYPSGGFVDVRDFGAVGDGTVDDTAAIQAAIDSLRTDGRVGGGITFPPGDYRLTDWIRVDYGTTLQGVNAALSRLVMTGGAPKDLVVGAGGFPAYALLRDLTLDGGLESQRAADVPTGNGTCRVVGPLAAGVPVDEIQISGSTCPIGIGDVLRTAGQPPIVVISGPGLGAGEDGRVRVCGWAPSTAVPENGARWHVYREGSLVRGIGRLTVERCLLMRAKRHAIELQSSTQGNISACEIGNNQGAGLFSWASTDYTLSRTWTYRNGGPDVFTYAGADIRISDCILEGSASTSITAHYSDLDVRTTGI